MLLRLLKSLRRTEAPRPRAQASADRSPVAHLARLNAAHAASPLETHLDIVHGALRIGEHDLTDLVRRCLRESGASVPPAKAFHRPLASYFLAQYFLYALGIAGARAECGVYAGTSTLLLCRAAQTRDRAYAGEDLHLIDSFEGLAAPADQDRFEAADGTLEAAMEKGGLAAPLDLVRNTFRDFPEVSFHRGWIPEVFSDLPATPWSFVHLDVDHYEPTHAGLAFFYPRLAPGGVIVCDDYGAPTFPGARRAWDRYCEANGVPYVVLDTGQSVILKSTAG